MNQKRILEVLSKIEPHDLDAYLDKKGWIKQMSPNPYQAIYNLSEVHNIGIPTSKNIQNYPGIIGLVITSLSKIEKRSQDVILNEIQKMNKPLESLKFEINLSVSTDSEQQIIEKVLYESIKYGIDAVSDNFKSKTGKIIRLDLDSLNIKSK